MVLERRHPTSLWEQAGRALRDVDLVAAANEVLIGVRDAGAQARTAADRA